jgi:hypothetical protein
MGSRRVNTLNVAAAAAVGLYYLSKGGGAGQRVRADPRRARPSLLLLGADDHVELGSAIRSAAAFGWSEALIADRFGVWFGCDRVRRSEGRAAARRGKNAIRLVPTAGAPGQGFREAVVVSLEPGHRPLGRTNLARGPKQLVVLPDERALDMSREDFGALADRVEWASVELPSSSAPAEYRCRLGASIALAEVARQVGARGARSTRSKRRRGPRYECSLRLGTAEEGGEVVLLGDLRASGY